MAVLRMYSKTRHKAREFRCGRESVMAKIKVGIIGCGNISGIYLQNLTKAFHNVELVACADLIAERGEAKSAEHGIKAMTVEAMLADPGISVIVHLTIPKAHAIVTLQALEAGKLSLIHI